MSQQTIGLLLGGVVPAILFGISGVLQKSSNQAGIGTGLYLLIIGAWVAVVGGAVSLLFPDRTVSPKSAFFASLIGLSWSAGVALTAVALTRFGAPLSRLVPLYNMNTLVAVVLSLAIFAEWRNVNVAQLGIGALLVVLGGILVAKA